MKRSSSSEFSNSKLTEYKQRIAHHEAGHAAAVHFNNRAKKLPPINYTIQLATWQYIAPSLLPSPNDPQTWVARVSGRFIQTLPTPLTLVASEVEKNQVRIKHALNPTFEADVVNLLVGPLAEAKYVALSDNEPFVLELLNIQSLSTNYGGEADITAVFEYIQMLATNQREQSLQRFFIEAFNFVNAKTNWQAITRLASHILASSQSEISCAEATSILESSALNLQPKLVPDVTQQRTLF